MSHPKIHRCLALLRRNDCTATRQYRDMVYMCSHTNHFRVLQYFRYALCLLCRSEFPMLRLAVIRLGVNSITTSFVFQNGLIGSRRKHHLTVRARTSCQPCSRYPTAEGTRCLVQMPSQTDPNSTKRPPRRPRLGRIPRRQPRRRCGRGRRLSREFCANICPPTLRYPRHRRTPSHQCPSPCTPDRSNSSRATSSRSRNKRPSRSRSRPRLFPLQHKHHPRPAPGSHNKHTRRPPHIHSSSPPNLPHNLKHIRPPSPPRSLLPRRPRLPNDPLPLPLRKHLSNHNPPPRLPLLPRPLPPVAELHLSRPHTQPSPPKANHTHRYDHARRRRGHRAIKTPHSRRQEDAHQAAPQARGLARREGGEGGGGARQGGARA